MKTYSPKAKDIVRNWHLIDAKEQILGRMSTKIVALLTGKHKPSYSTHMDMGDNVVVINASTVRLTGRKEKEKTYYRHTGYPKGLREVKLPKMREDHPEKIIELAVKRMLPKNRLRDKRMARLHVFASQEHNFAKKFGEEK